MKKDLITVFLGLLSQLKVLHWQTETYSRHMAYDRIYESMGGLVDTFIEAYQGKKGRIRVTEAINLINIDGDINCFIESYLTFFTVELPESLNEDDVDLLAIRDEMVQELNVLKYLLTLK